MDVGHIRSSPLIRPAGGVEGPRAPHRVGRGSIGAPNIGDVGEGFSRSIRDMTGNVRLVRNEDRNIAENPSVKDHFDVPGVGVPSGNGSESSRLQQLLGGGQQDEVHKFLDEAPREKIANILQETLCAVAGDKKASTLLMKVICDKFPEVARYVATRDTDQARLISIEGVKLLAAHLTEKGSLQISTNTCSSYDDLGATLRKLESENHPDGFRTGIFLKNAGGPESLGLFETFHVTPIYIEKRNGQLHVVITDSTGGASNYGFFIGQAIRKACPDAEIYRLTTKRQHDDTNCPIFALRDMAKISQNPGFLDFVQLKARERLEQAPAKPPGRSRRAGPNLNADVQATPTKPIHDFAGLPPSMMKVSQSLSTVEPLREEVVTSRKAPGGRETLGQAVDRHTIQDPKEDRKINALAARRFSKYERIVVAQVVNQALDIR